MNGASIPSFVRLAAGLVLATSLLVVSGSISAEPAASAAETYLIVYSGAAVPADAATSMATAGGTLVYSYVALV